MGNRILWVTQFVALTCWIVCLAAQSYFIPSAMGQEAVDVIEIGIIGLDTSHAIEFTRLFNQPSEDRNSTQFRVVCAYPQGSRDINTSVSRIPKYTAEIKGMGVTIVDSIEELVDRVDAVLLETNDGRLHLEQAIPVLKARKPLFIDKPLAGSLDDVLIIFEIADRYQTPVFSSSALRFVENSQRARDGSLVGAVVGCDTFSPCEIESTHPDLYWYGIHGVEQLFTIMGPDCTSVTRTSTDTGEVVSGVWDGGRVGTFRGIRSGKAGFGGTVFGNDGIDSAGGFDGYGELVKEIGRFFASGKSPVSREETVAIYAFMSAADESKLGGGTPFKLADVVLHAKARAAKKLETLDGLN